MDKKILVRMPWNEFACIFHTVTNKFMALLSYEELCSCLDECKRKFGFTIEKSCKSTITLLFNSEIAVNQFIVFCRDSVHPRLPDRFVIK